MRRQFTPRRDIAPHPPASRVPPSPRSRRAVRGRKGSCKATIPLDRDRSQEPSPPFRGEREGPAHRYIGPPHPALSPLADGRRGERVKSASFEPNFAGKPSERFPRTALPLA